ncbi:hypothetical protein MITSMUL_03703 [Mitsuokella multacida DSM 20544]|uniref:Uncharacterized protein n=1 Tax=Mitsuokella multacida DSM 20544 TaxID=500635 RepID=C9KKK4_9FIRM|nr:hypothetical protein MITSMUL_03703 [Mitsuokella multacida DSM 20544]
MHLIRDLTVEYLSTKKAPTRELFDVDCCYLNGENKLVFRSHFLLEFGDELSEITYILKFRTPETLVR